MKRAIIDHAMYPLQEGNHISIIKNMVYFLIYEEELP